MNPTGRSEVESRADFSRLRYAQCWEDADTLVQGLAVRPGDTVVSIASAGDNSLALLAESPARVLAVDLSAAQLAALALRIAAYRSLDHDALLELLGARPSSRRLVLYAQLRGALDESTRAWWDAHVSDVAMGIGAAGRFERYFAIFRTWVLPLIHGRATRHALLQPREQAARATFHDTRWDTWRWRMLFRAFFSEWVLGRLGRDPAFFRYVEGAVGERLRRRVRHALVDLDPASNPYLHWILTGTYGEQLPRALRAEQVDRIRAGLDRISLHHAPLERVLQDQGLGRVHRFNLSNIFEYMSLDAHRTLMEACLAVAPPGARFAYWNLFVPRNGASLIPARLRSLSEESAALHARDQTFFYSAFVLEEVVA
jgi:S-adenosylmethionine-diacylglycerol 3-amino-3-carboxypropyl transferase